jgi:hypothetical protein
MQTLTKQGQQLIEDLAHRYGVSTEAVLTLLQALILGNGTMAQFNHPELGGSGQWMQGGMTMVGDMFNYALKAKVDGLCAELSALLANQPAWVRPVSSQSQSQGGYQPSAAVSLFVPSAGGTAGQWWPADLGVPAATGAQNSIRYAYFPATRRLAIEINGHVSVYDTQNHQIGGVSQQQSMDASLTFTSQFGLVRVSDLPVVAIDGVPQAKTRTATGVPQAETRTAAGVPQAETRTAAGVPQAETQAAVKAELTPPIPAEGTAEAIFAMIERLAELRQKNVLSEEEFTAKKAELLSRL